MFAEAASKHADRMKTPCPKVSDVEGLSTMNASDIILLLLLANDRRWHSHGPSGTDLRVRSAFR